MLGADGEKDCIEIAGGIDVDGSGGMMICAQTVGQLWPIVVEKEFDSQALVVVRVGAGKVRMDVASGGIGRLGPSSRGWVSREGSLAGG